MSNMTQKKVFEWIKTPCGREKYTYLNTKKGFLAKIRLAWFVIFAAIEDWNITNPDQIEDSES